MARFISTAPKKTRRSKVIIVLNVIIGFLIAGILLTVIGYLNNSEGKYYDRSFGDTMTHYSIEREDYADLTYYYYYDGGIIGRVNKGYEDVAAVAKYADAAFRYNAYEKAGDSERAARQKKRMEEAASAVGIYAPELTKIDNKLMR